MYFAIFSMIVLMIVLIIIVIILIVPEIKKIKLDDIFESPQKRAGKKGEFFATNVIKSTLREDDLLFTNINISYDGRPAELDNVVVNQYGIFIIEVKNYSGKLVGTEDDYEWQKYHTTPSGNTYFKMVKNPIKQVKRQVYILAKYLYFYGVDVWVSGFAFLINRNSPVVSEYVLTDINDIDKVIHNSNRNRLTSKTIEKIASILSK